MTALRWRVSPDLSWYQWWCFSLTWFNLLEHVNVTRDSIYCKTRQWKILLTWKGDTLHDQLYLSKFCYWLQNLIKRDSWLIQLYLRNVNALRDASRIGKTWFTCFARIFYYEMNNRQSARKIFILCFFLDFFSKIWNLVSSKWTVNGSICWSCKCSLYFIAPCHYPAPSCAQMPVLVSAQSSYCDT